MSLLSSLESLESHTTLKASSTHSFGVEVAWYNKGSRLGVRLGRYLEENRRSPKEAIVPNAEIYGAAT